MSKTAAGPWIPVSERLPEIGVDVLFAFERAGKFVVGRVNSVTYWKSKDEVIITVEYYCTATHEGMYDDPTHWAEITPPSTNTDHE